MQAKERDDSDYWSFKEEIKTNWVVRETAKKGRFIPFP